MTIEKVLPVQIEVDSENPAMCSCDCDCCEECRICRRYDFNFYDESYNGKRHPDCIKDFGIPSTQTDIDYANAQLNKAQERIKRLEDQNQLDVTTIRKLQRDIQTVQDDNRRLAHALDGKDNGKLIIEQEYLVLQPKG